MQLSWLQAATKKGGQRGKKSSKKRKNRSARHRSLIPRRLDKGRSVLRSFVIYVQTLRHSEQYGTDQTYRESLSLPVKSLTRKLSLPVWTGMDTFQYRSDLFRFEFEKQ